MVNPRFEQLLWAYNERPRLSSSIPGYGVRAASAGLGDITPTTSGWIAGVLWKNALARGERARFGFARTERGDLVYRMVRKGGEHARPMLAHALVASHPLRWVEIVSLILTGPWIDSDDGLDPSTTRLRSVDRVDHLHPDAVHQRLRSGLGTGQLQVDDLAPVLAALLGGAGSLMVSGTPNTAVAALLAALALVEGKIPVNHVMTHVPADELVDLDGAHLFVAGEPVGRTRLPHVAIPSAVTSGGPLDEFAIEVAGAYLDGHRHNSRLLALERAETLGDLAVLLAIENGSPVAELLPALRSAPRRAGNLDRDQAIEALDLILAGEAGDSDRAMVEAIAETHTSTLVSDGWINALRSLASEATLPPDVDQINDLADRMYRITVLVDGPVSRQEQAAGHEELPRCLGGTQMSLAARLVALIYLLDRCETDDEDRPAAITDICTVAWSELAEAAAAVAAMAPYLLAPVVVYSIRDGERDSDPIADLLADPVTRNATAQAIGHLLTYALKSSHITSAVVTLLQAGSRQVVLDFLAANLRGWQEDQDTTLIANQVVTSVLADGFSAAQMLQAAQVHGAAAAPLIASWLESESNTDHDGTLTLHLWERHHELVPHYTDTALRLIWDRLRAGVDGTGTGPRQDRYQAFLDALREPARARLRSELLNDLLAKLASPQATAWAKLADNLAGTEEYATAIHAGYRSLRAIDRHRFLERLNSVGLARPEDVDEPWPLYLEAGAGGGHAGWELADLFFAALRSGPPAPDQLFVLTRNDVIGTTLRHLMDLPAVAVERAIETIVGDKDWAGRKLWEAADRTPGAGAIARHLERYAPPPAASPSKSDPGGGVGNGPGQDRDSHAGDHHGDKDPAKQPGPPGDHSPARPHPPDSDQGRGDQKDVDPGEGFVSWPERVAGHTALLSLAAVVSAAVARVASIRSARWLLISYAVITLSVWLGRLGSSATSFVRERRRHNLPNPYRDDMVTVAMVTFVCASAHLLRRQPVLGLVIMTAMLVVGVLARSFATPDARHQKEQVA